MAVVIVILYRLLMSLPILKWPLAGGILAIVADNFDIVVISAFHLADVSFYNPLDKTLDMVYLAFELYVSLRWKNQLAKRVSIILFIWRLVGFGLYELTHVRWLLIIFPNLFENFFILYLAWVKIARKDPFTTMKAMSMLLLIALIPKLAQEYMLHVIEFPIYVWLTDHIFAPIGLDKYLR